MVEYILSSIICQEFEKAVGKGQHETGKAMHMGFHLHPENGDQYCVMHMYLHAPGNYVFVAVQGERIDDRGRRSVGAMKILCYHDSCWRDSIQRFVFDHRQRLSTCRAFCKLFDWYDVLELTEDERKYLRKKNDWDMSSEHRGEAYKEPNPFDGRGIWAGK